LTVVKGDEVLLGNNDVFGKDFLLCAQVFWCGRDAEVLLGNRFVFGEDFLFSSRHMPVHMREGVDV